MTSIKSTIDRKTRETDIHLEPSLMVPARQVGIPFRS